MWLHIPIQVVIEMRNRAAIAVKQALRTERGHHLCQLAYYQGIVNEHYKQRRN